MEMTTYYGMDRNPFTKDTMIKTLYESNDFKQMTNRCIFKQSWDGKDHMSEKNIGISQPQSICSNLYLYDNDYSHRFLQNA